MVCKNCSHVYEGNFCPVCGQSSRVRRFDFKSLLLSFIEWEKRFFRSFYLLTLTPGISINEYLDGKRSRLFDPGKFLLVTGSIATILVANLPVFEVSGGLEPVEGWLKDQNGYHNFSEKYYTFVNVIGIFLYTLVSWIVYRRYRYSLMELAVINIFITSYQFFILILFSPFFAITGGANDMLSYGFNLVTGLYQVWVFWLLFVDKWWKRLMRISVLMILSVVGSYFLNWLVYLAIPSQWLIEFDKLFG